MISMNYGSSTSSWKSWRWVRLDLILSMSDIYISIPTWTHRQNSLSSGSTDYPPMQRYPPMEHLSNNKHRPNNQHDNSQEPCDEYDEKSIETETTWSEFPNVGKPIRFPVNFGRFSRPIILYNTCGHLTIRLCIRMMLLYFAYCCFSHKTK